MAAKEPLSDLECPICIEVRADCHIYQCSNGHIVCQECYKGISTCPICRTQLPREGMRNRVAETEIASR